MDTVELTEKTWTLGGRIGDPSGFGKVFEATADDGTIGVVKLVPKEPGAERELLFEELEGVQNVVPVIDSGEWDDYWALAMPRADRSLRAEMESTAEALTNNQALPILIDIAQALSELSDHVVHRDLKPENILLLDGRWCLADFGIARYAEASTQPDTRKMAMSPPYTAPERWRFERATSAADVYSLGVMAWEMLMGHRPFQGPSWDDYREQHLHEESPEISGLPPNLASLVGECLYKASSARPTPHNLVARLGKSLSLPSPAAEGLQAVNQAVAAERAKQQAEASRASSEAARRRELYNSAARSLRGVSAWMRKAVLENASAASVDSRSSADDWALCLGQASIGMDPAEKVSDEAFGRFVPPFDVIAFAAIGIQIPQDRYGYTGRSHSLWYGDLQEQGVYRWYEAGFMVSPMIPKSLPQVPAAMPPGENSGKAFASGLAEWSLARPVVPIDQGEEQAFVERWLHWFGEAAAGQLQSPRSLPEEGGARGSYRKQ